ncbi:hypothetical protein TBLA_0E01280 [Henningerozyma blattae CBS 6284]|uniref:Pre-mRNA-splicing factor CWC24 n=1 Tax=Henningerozyma blattae (strain ATCC 34711 / CBS 6284 / DSM 70876 / NBRC 10599 / NRRL Y-10934 / UCD 77-7) TaxID=1071380 RepID=I2H486_HENB6|nr:hypothetical protein TBLA_0E01280 [Tetrapisispora blattae CBS 6284]CCH61188.1 hypothetical protein TBLA_0E01280 [Tetrapisispora blattae CBS 6284]
MFKKRNIIGNKRKREGIKESTQNNENTGEENITLKARKIVVGSLAISADSKIKNSTVKETEVSKEKEQGKDIHDSNEVSAKEMKNRIGFTMRSQKSQITQPSNVKISTLMDYQPDICKDFFQNGYCGYGDNCKFLHTREKLNEYSNEFRPNKNEVSKIGRQNESKPVNNIKDDNSIPKECKICNRELKKPIIKTNCDHYFCNDCFVKSIIKSTNCKVCGKDTQGVGKIFKIKN